MASVNRIFLIGFLGKDPELKSTTQGKEFCKFPLATSESWKDKDGTNQQKSQWHNIIMWGKVAEIAGANLRKGSCIYLEGQIEYTSWDGDDGQKKYMTQIVGKEFKFLDKKGTSGATKEVEPELAF